jgi:hypothetical protein
MSKNPQFDYSEFCLKGFIKAFPILSEADPQEVAYWLYSTASAFSGRDGRSLAGGGESDIVCLVAAAASIEIEVCSAREIKDTLCAKLRSAWLENNHVTILSIARGFERTAAMTVVNLRDVDWADPYRILNEVEEEVVDISNEVETWIETLCEPSQARSVIGNQSRNRLRRNPIEQVVKSLFEGDL